jgi:hypothetical protein
MLAPNVGLEPTTSTLTVSLPYRQGPMGMKELVQSAGSSPALPAQGRRSLKLNYDHVLVRLSGFEPPRPKALHSECSKSTSFITTAYCVGTSARNRT